MVCVDELLVYDDIVYSFLGEVKYMFLEVFDVVLGKKVLFMRIGKCWVYNDESSLWMGVLVVLGMGVVVMLWGFIRVIVFCI